MKTTKIKIKSLFGIKELDLDGRSVELSGKNGAGKTSVIDAIRFALTNKSERDYIIKKGETEGEIFIETDSGVSIHRKVRTQQADYKSVKNGNVTVSSAESFLREIFTELQLSPVQFLNMTKQEQNRIILDMIDFPWDLQWIREQFGEIPPDVNYDQNILQVLGDIQSEKGHYFMARQDVNRDIRNKRVFVEEIGAAIPAGYQVEKWEAADLGGIYKEIESKRAKNAQIEKAHQMKEQQNNKKRGFEAQREIDIAAIDKEISYERTSLETEIAKLEEQLKARRDSLANLSDKRALLVESATERYNTAVAKYEGEMAQYEPYLAIEKEDVQPLVDEATEIERMKAFINEYRRMTSLQNELEKLQEKTEFYTRQIEKARTLPGEILKTAKIPVEGLTVVDGIPHINGLPISNLSEGEKLDLCIDVTLQKPGNLQIVLIDGVEKLSTENRERLYKKCLQHGLQFIATRTDDSDELVVTHLS